MENTKDAVLLIAVCVMSNPRGIFIPLVRSVTNSDSRWKIPGGSKEVGETNSQAAFREFKQETKITPKGKIIYEKELFVINKRPDHKQIVLVCGLEDITPPPAEQVVEDGREQLITVLFPFKEVATYFKKGKKPELLRGFKMLEPHEKALHTVLVTELRDLYEGV